MVGAFRKPSCGRRFKPIHSTLSIVAFCPWRGTLITTTLYYEVVINNIYDRTGTKFWSKAMVFAWLGIEEFNPGP